MFTVAKWIGAAPGELGFRSDEELTDEQMEARKQRAIDGEDPTRRGSLLLRGEFRLNSPAAKAKLLIAGLGFYRLTVNGAAPDERRLFAPIVSDYERRIKYDEYDVTGLLRTGLNCVCVELGPGWFTGNPKYWGWQQTWYGNPRLLAELTVSDEKGVKTVFATDATWKQAPGSVISSCVYDGEIQDLSVAPKDWDKPGFSASEWQNAAEVESPAGELTPCEAPPVRSIRTLRPVYEKRLSPAEILFDFGENSAAVPRVTVRGKKGDTVILRHAEFLTPEGTLDTRSENWALCADTFILPGGGTEVLSPRFSPHGYRYMTVTLSSPDMAVEKAESLVIHSDVAITGAFECGSEKLNRLHGVYVRTMLACLQGVPVDCPQRDERKGWLGDAYAVSEACLYNFDMRSLYADWLEDMKRGRHSRLGHIPFLCPSFGEGETSIDWNLAYPVILEDHYARYGDRSLLERHYDTLKEHTQYYISTSKDGMIPPCWFGDWCTPDIPEGQERVAFCAGGDDHRQNPPFAATLFYAQTLRVSAEIADILGHADDAERFRARREEARRALLERYFDPGTGRFGSGGQFLQTMLLAEDLADEKDRPAAVGALMREIEARDCHPFVGVLGLRRVYDLLCELGRPETAWRMLTVEGYPGQFHMLSGGRTTLTERLDHSGSGDHCMFASPDTFLYRRLGGVTVDRRSQIPVVIAPYCPDDLPYARCSQRLPEGEVRVSWERLDGAVEFDIRIPAGIAAKLDLRTGTDSYTELLPDGGSRRLRLTDARSGERRAADSIIRGEI